MIHAAVGTSLVLGLLCHAGSAFAARPAFADGATALSADGTSVRVHYVLDGSDAVPLADGDSNGTPDFVDEVVVRADESLAAYLALGFRAPLSDGARTDNGGDARFDIYLQNFEVADGSFGVDSCTAQPSHCIGYVTMENDFVGFSYPSRSIAIKTLTSHELFHAVQAAYDSDQTGTWSEGSAVWAEEFVFPEQDDFERLAAGFLAKPFRPFERGGGGFGDSYPYGAAMWPYFLEHWLSSDVVVATWEACEDLGDDPNFLEAAAAVLPAWDTTLVDAFIEFTRWNAETGSEARPGRYPEAGRLATVPRETLLLGIPATTTLSTEGMSARYLPIELSADAQVTITAERDVAVWLRVADGGAPVEVVRADAGTDHTVGREHVLVVRLSEARRLELVVTGVGRLTLPGDVVVDVSVAPAVEEPTEDDGGGCSATSGSTSGTAWLLGLVGLVAVRRRRNAKR